MDEKSIQRLSRDECIEKLKEIGQHGPGTLEEMKMKLRKFSLYPKLYQHLKLKTQRQYKFECTIPHINSQSNPPPPIINVVCKYLRQFLDTSFGVATLPIYCNVMLFTSI